LFGGKEEEEDGDGSGVVVVVVGEMKEEMEEEEVVEFVVKMEVERVEKWLAKWVTMAAKVRGLLASCSLLEERRRREIIMKERERGKHLYKGINDYKFDLESHFCDETCVSSPNAAHILAFRPKWAKRGN